MKRQAPKAEPQKAQQQDDDAVDKRLSELDDRVAKLERILASNMPGAE
jgi:hypothetical protein